MFEAMTYDTIMQRMLDQIPDDMDKREGSVIWDALSPAALELELAYIALDYTLMQGFADTQEREYLIRRCAERGIAPEAATKAILKGEFTPTSIDMVGKRFSLNKLNYVVQEAIADVAGAYKVQCETEGAEGNQNLGSLIPIEYVDGLETASLTEVLIPGEDEEETETLRARYMASFAQKSCGGNKQNYLEKTNALDGVGATKVTPIWDGGGTVKLTILNSDYDKASATLISAVQEAIDPTPQGTGLGIAPIGHTVTVDTVTETTVNISTILEFDTGYSWENLTTAITAAMTAYLLALRQTWASNSALTVRISQIESRLLAIDGIADISGTQINGSAANLTITGSAIPIMGAVTNGSDS